jgi:hypothetical protein
MTYRYASFVAPQARQSKLSPNRGNEHNPVNIEQHRASYDPDAACL